MHATLRRPAVAGRFYPADPQTLLGEVQSYINPQKRHLSAIGCVAPHAGYMYSGHVAGAVYSELKVPATCIVMCPNHTGYGKPMSIMSEGEWETPLGRVPIDSGLATALKQQCGLLQEDLLAHRSEHGVEVQLPFLQAK